ncbi:MFS transporter permease, partial [Klebsiella pneumoniae]
EKPVSFLMNVVSGTVPVCTR